MARRATMLLAGAATVCLISTGAFSEPLKLGWNTELSGPWTFTGNACLDGAEMALEEVNASGQKIDFIVRDNQTNPAQASAFARSLDSDGVDLISGSTNADAALAIYGYVEQNALPYLVPVASFPQLTKPGTKHTFRMEPDSAGWGYATAKFIAALKPGAKVAVVINDFAINRAVLAGFKYQAPLEGLSIVEEVIFPQNATDASVQAAQIKTKNPDYVFVAGGSGAFDPTLTTQLLDIGFKPEQLVHPYGSTSKQITNWGERSAGSYYGTFFDANISDINDAGRSFVQKFREKNGYSPGFIEHNCYIAINFVGELVDAGVSDRDSVLAALRSANSKEKTTGIPIYFDENGARVAWMYFMQLEKLTKDDFKARQVNYLQWTADALPVYELVK